MEQSCSKPYQYFDDETERGVVYDGPNRNEPISRTYRMRKRPPAQVYHCVQCNKHIKYPSKITEHIRKHTGEKPHVCHVCHQSFSQAHTLKNHMVQHVHEKPFKCSFCAAEFLDVCQKNDHEAQHMHHHPEHQSETMEEPFLQTDEPQVQEEEEDVEPIEEGAQLCGIYECPLSCGFQSFDEAVVVEHIAVEHERYPTEEVCWQEEDHPPPPPSLPPTTTDTTNAIKLEMLEEHNHVYEFFDERFVPQVAAEMVVEPSSSNYRHQDIIYEHVETPEVAHPSHTKQVYGQMILEDLEEEVEDVGVVGADDDEEEEEEQERVRVFVNPNPPKRGTKSARDHHEASAAITEMVVDAATLEMAAPTRHLKHGYPAVRKKRGKKAQNLDWIIDAVAKGVDVNEASPHHRKKPTLHKCEFCGKIDKYPSKIRAHLRTHTGEKPFKCDICGMSFSQRTPMRLHLRRHFDQKPYECDVDGCKERFVSGAILKLHVEKKHLNKKKYVCIRGCGRVFSSAFNQRHHEKKCSQNAYMTWVEENNETGDESNGEYGEEDDEYTDEMMMMVDPSVPQPVRPEFAEEPVFLHQ